MYNNNNNDMGGIGTNFANILYTNTFPQKDSQGDCSNHRPKG